MGRAAIKRGSDSATLDLFASSSNGAGCDRQAEAGTGAVEHQGAAGDVRAAMRARQNRRQTILDYFLARPGWRIPSAELHREFGSAFRSRVSEINRDPDVPLRILNQTTTGPDGEHSYYFAQPRAADVLDWAMPKARPAGGRMEVGAAGVAGGHRGGLLEARPYLVGNRACDAAELPGVQSAFGAPARAEIQRHGLRPSEGVLRDVVVATAGPSSVAPPAWAVHECECEPPCRCFHHTFCGPGGAPCIACPA